MKQDADYIKIESPEEVKTFIDTVTGSMNIVEESTENVSEEVKSFKLKDLDSALKENELTEDSSIEDITAACIEYNNIIQAVSKKTLDLVVKTGNLLNLAFTKIPHGEWDIYCKEELGVGGKGGYSTVTIWRYRKVANYFSRRSTDGYTLQQAYVEAGVAKNEWSQVELVYNKLYGYIDIIDKLKTTYEKKVRKDFECLYDKLDMTLMTNEDFYKIKEAEEAFENEVNDMKYIVERVLYRFPNGTRMYGARDEEIREYEKGLKKHEEDNRVEEEEATCSGNGDISEF